MLKVENKILIQNDMNTNCFHLSSVVSKNRSLNVPQKIARKLNSINGGDFFAPDTSTTPSKCQDD